MNFIEFKGQLINLDQVSRIHTSGIINPFEELKSGERPTVQEHQIIISFNGNSYTNSLKFYFESKEQRTASFNLLKSLTVKDI